MSIVLLNTLILYAQLDDEDYISQIFEEDEYYSLSDVLLANTVKRLLGNKWKFILADYILYTEYDMFGDVFMKGTISYNFSRTKENNFTYTEGYTSWWRDVIKDARKVFERRTVGLRFTHSDWKHTIVGGKRYPLKFTPYTLDKLTLFGIMYDLRKAEELNFKVFFTTKFREIANNLEDITAKGQTDDVLDNMLIASRMVVDIGGLFRNLPSIFDGQRLGISFLRKSLSNDGKSARNYIDEFVIKRRTIFEQFNAGDEYINNFNNWEYLIGADLRGKIATFFYNFEYVWDYREDGKVLGDAIPYSIKMYKSSDFAFTGAFNSDDILNKRSDKFIISADLKGWYIGDNYGANWANDDDDDDDNVLDENDWYNDNKHPWENGDTGFDEPLDYVKPEVYNQNKNDLFDYEEDFLIFYADRGFLEIPLFEDANYNMMLDYIEDDFDPDFPYDRDRGGTRYVAGINPFSIGLFYIGGVYNWKLSDKSKKTKSIIGGYSYVKENLLDVFNISVHYVFNKVEDTIPDNFVSPANNVLISDMLPNKDNIINQIYLTAELTKFDDLTLAFKIRRGFNDALDREFKKRLIIDIFKIGYDIRLLRNKLTLSPQYKFERYKNQFYGPGNVEETISKYPLISHLKEDYKRNIVIFRIRLDIISSVYFITGIQFKSHMDNYQPVNSYRGLVVPVEILLKGRKYQEGRYSTGKIDLIGIAMGYRFTYRNYPSDSIYKKNEVFIRILIPM